MNQQMNQASFGANGEQKHSLARLSDRLDEARHQQFVGREAERNLFKSTVTATELPFLVLYIFGPGGVGKTSLLREFTYICVQARIKAAYIDARDIQPSPQAFIQALQHAVNPAAVNASLGTLVPQPDRQVVMIDTYEQLAPLDGWLRKVFLPQLPANTLIVLAGRDELPLPWRIDTGWRALIREMTLRNFSPEESQAFLAAQGIPARRRQKILNFTHGHPLALSLIADEFAQHGDLNDDFDPDASPDMIKILLDRFIQETPSAAHRTALEACAQVRLMTEPLLAQMVAVSDAHALFEWLRRLSFVESAERGIFLHDLTAKALAIDLRWRNAELHADLLKRARAYYTARLQQANVEEQQRVIADYISLHRHNPVVQPFFQASGHISAVVDSAREADWPALIEMVAGHEGRRSARLAEIWFERQPHNVLVIRSMESESELTPLGLMMTLALHEADAEDLEADPATKAAWQYLQEHAPLRPGEKAIMFRFWMARDGYQTFSPIQSLIGVNMVRHYLTTPGLAFSFFPCAEPDFWALLCAYANLPRLLEADFEIDGRRYGVYGHDWRVTPPLQWLDILAERENSSQPQQTPPVAEPLIVLSRSEFTTAVWEVFRNLSNPDALRRNPLLRSRLVVKSTEATTTKAEQIAYLQNLVVQTTETLQASPRQTKFYRALYHTYLQPAPTQEKAAELLDLPFSTFRRHLKAGLTAVTDALWRQEIGTDPGR